MENDTIDIIVSDTIASVGEPWNQGLDPVDRPTSLHPHSLVTTIVIILFTLIALASRHLRHILSAIATEMLGVRRRNNAFDTHTSAETRTLGLLIILGTTCQAIILGALVMPDYASSPRLFGMFAGVTAAYYLFQLAAYSIVGYTFTDVAACASWRRGFNLSEGLLGILLFLPAIVILFYPTLSVLFIIIGLIIYFAIRLSFIYKGFRIFYNGYGSYVYFILYLCALEIIPLLAIYSVANHLSAYN